MSVGNLLAMPTVAPKLSSNAPKKLVNSGLTVQAVPEKVSSEAFTRIADRASSIHSRLKNLDNTQAIKLDENPDLKAFVEDSRLISVDQGSEASLFTGKKVHFTKSDNFDSGTSFSFEFSKEKSFPSYESMHTPLRDRVLGSDGRHQDRPSARFVPTGSITIRKLANRTSLEINQSTSSGSSMKSFELV